MSSTVCPQFDALDLMTTREHLEFYARVRGIIDVRLDVDTVLAMVGLTSYESFLAAKLSGGNKRKLSLAISLLGTFQFSPGIWLPQTAASNCDNCQAIPTSYSSTSQARPWMQ